MIPTTYRGDATIQGERLDVELRLDDDRIRLVQGRRFEIVSWPLASVEVESVAKGTYIVNAGNDSFEFSPRVDDGLGDEIALRARFAGSGSVLAPPRPSVREAEDGRREPVRVDPTETEAVARDVPARGRTRPPASRSVDSETLADRIAQAGARQRLQRRPLSDDEVEDRRVYLGVALLVGIIAMVALVASIFFTDSEDPAPTAAPTSNTLGFTGGPTPTTTQPAPTTTVPVPSTTTPPTTVPPTESALAMNIDEFTARWDAMALELAAPLGVADMVVEGDQFSFKSGYLVDMSGTIGPDGTVDFIRFSGDPHGTIDEDRLVLTTLGMTISAAAPDLEPSGRRAMLEALGLDISYPQLAGLDGAITYADNVYRLRWDDESERIVFQVADEATDTALLESSSADEASGEE